MDEQLDRISGPIASEIEGVARRYAVGKLPCELGDAATEVAVEGVQAVMRHLASAWN